MNCIGERLTAMVKEGQAAACAHSLRQEPTRRSPRSGRSPRQAGMKSMQVESSHAPDGASAATPRRRSCARFEDRAAAGSRSSSRRSAQGQRAGRAPGACAAGCGYVHAFLEKAMGAARFELRLVECQIGTTKKFASTPRFLPSGGGGRDADRGADMHMPGPPRSKVVSKARF